METAVGTRAPSHARAVFRRLGAVLTVAGLGFLAWGLATWQWGDPVTGLYTRWEQRQLTERYEQLVEAYEPPAVGAGTSDASPDREVRRAAQRFRASVQNGDPIGRLLVDRLGLNMVVVDGTDASALRKGPGRDHASFMPGQGELVYIAGHRTTFGAPFAHIDRLEGGDRVELEMPYGRFAYRVTETVIVPADDVDRLRSRGREELALQACHPRFSASQRIIVYARPIAGP